jgi:hypothetical protein
MISKRITYFERSGKENTEDVIDIVTDRLKEGDIKSVVVASSRGETGLKFARRLANTTNLIVVSSHPGQVKISPYFFQEMVLPGNTFQFETHNCLDQDAHEAP